MYDIRNGFGCDPTKYPVRIYSLVDNERSKSGVFQILGRFGLLCATAWLAHATSE